MKCNNCGASLVGELECEYYQPKKSTSICRNQNRFSDFYKKYPDLFLENYLNMQLFPYQKAILRNMVKTK